MSLDTSLKKLKDNAWKRYKVWLTQAKFDLDAAKMSLGHGYHEWAAYQAEQAVEKAIKSVIVNAGWMPPRVHKIPVLLGIANQANKEFAMTKFQFKHLESFTFISRYPFLLPGVEVTPHEQIKYNDAKKAVDQAEDIYDKVTEILKHKPESAMEEIYAYRHFTEAEIKKRLEDVVSVLVREFNAQKVLLFGSFAREKTPDRSSTMDILVIGETDLPFIERIIAARNATKGGEPIIEPIVYTPEEFKTLTQEEGESFFEYALSEGKVLFER